MCVCVYVHPVSGEALKNIGTAMSRTVYTQEQQNNDNHMHTATREWESNLFWINK